MWIGGLAAFVAALAAALAAPSALATFPGGNGLIAYVDEPTPGDDVFELDVFTVEPDRSSSQNLTADLPGITSSSTSAPLSSA